ncbi:MAG: hypothetical protein ACR2OV_08165 [Hyphomicrobiaceae bacterium]
MRFSGSILHRLIGLTAALALTFVLINFSRFWIWKGPWANDGLFGLKIFSPFGSMVQFWLRGTALSTFDIVVWGCGAIVALSIIQWLTSRIVPPAD